MDGWNDRWAALLADVPNATGAARVVRHDGTSLLVARAEGTDRVHLSHRLDPEPTVGDWIALVGDEPVRVLPRTGLLRRRAANTDEEQALAANVDLVLLVCGLDRPLKTGRIQRAATLAWDAGATPVLVLTKSDLLDPAEVDVVVEELRAENPGLDVVITSVDEPMDELRDLIGDRTVTLLGESGAGKSSLVNVLTGADSAATGHVRAGDAKGRHTTTTRQLHPLPGGGAVIDSPGIRSVGLWVDPDAVDQTFADIDELSDGCRFTDCRHETEPGCAVRAAIDAGTLQADRLDDWVALRKEAESAALRADRAALHKEQRAWGRVSRQAQEHKGRG
jgi:ribosome biogenesis GTPase